MTSLADSSTNSGGTQHCCSVSASVTSIAKYTVPFLLGVALTSFLTYDFFDETQSRTEKRSVKTAAQNASVDRASILQAGLRIYSPWKADDATLVDQSANQDDDTMVTAGLSAPQEVLPSLCMLGDKPMEPFSTKTVLSMSDTFDLRNRPKAKSWDDLDYREITSTLAYEYARMHGYEFIYYLFRGSGDCAPDPERTCFHPRHGVRHASWCKLLSISMTLRNMNYPSLFHMDSDMAIHMPERSVLEYLHRNHTCALSVNQAYFRLDDGKVSYKNEFRAEAFDVFISHRDRGVHCDSPRCAAVKKQATVALLKDMSGDVAVNCGYTMWNFLSPHRLQSSELLADWWRTPHHGFPWEQFVMDAEMIAHRSHQILPIGCENDGEQVLYESLTHPNWTDPELVDLKQNKLIYHRVHFGENTPHRRQKVFSS